MDFNVFWKRIPPNEQRHPFALLFFIPPHRTFVQGHPLFLLTPQFLQNKHSIMHHWKQYRVNEIETMLMFSIIFLI
jgi:hypothetical protein